MHYASPLPRFKNFIGQHEKDVRLLQSAFIHSVTPLALLPLNHLLFLGLSGLGKTTLTAALAAAMESKCHILKSLIETLMNPQSVTNCGKFSSHF